jgi:hypothetical protein
MQNEKINKNQQNKNKNKPNNSHHNLLIFSQKLQ